MKKSTKKIAKTFLLITAALCVALILMQLVPYWTYQNTKTESEDTISILEYLALPFSHPDVTKMLDSSKPAVINSLAGTFCIALLLGVVSIVVSIVKSNTRWASVFPVVVGVGTLIGYLTEPRWALGGSMHIVLIIISAALTICALVPFCIGLYSIKYWFMDPKDWPSAKK